MESQKHTHTHTQIIIIIFAYFYTNSHFYIFLNWGIIYSSGKNNSLSNLNNLVIDLVLDFHCKLVIKNYTLTARGKIQHLLTTSFE